MRGCKHTAAATQVRLVLPVAMIARHAFNGAQLSLSLVVELRLIGQGALSQPASEILHVLRGETSLRGLRGLNGLPTSGEPFEIDQLMFCFLLYLGWRNNQLLQLDPSLLQFR